jgi:hypothetical protein
LVVAADGTHSNTRQLIFPDAPTPEFTGQAVWRYNFERPAEVDGFRAYQGPVGVGLVPLAANLMYMFVTMPIGEIKPGMLADLLLVQGDPTSDVTVLQNKNNLRAIMQDGRFFKSPAIH